LKVLIKNGKLGAVVHTCNPSTQEAVWQEEYESEANLSYIAIICLKKKEGTVK
jgi:hypothetical protein